MLYGSLAEGWFRVLPFSNPASDIARTNFLSTSFVHLEGINSGVF
jgi:hypothetical protein